MASRNAQAPTTGPNEGDEDRSLSCPYYKGDRMLHMGCVHLKLKRIKDVKHHLLKRHRRPLYCSICGRTDFVNVAARDGHVQARECIAPPGGFAIQGLDLDQVAQLGRRANRRLDTAEQWMEIWDILFPGIARPPSPFMGSFVEEFVSMFGEHWNARAEDIFNERAATLLSNQPHLRQVFYQATCNVVEGLLSSVLAINAAIKGRTAPPVSLNPGAPQAAIPGNSPQPFEGTLCMNPNDLICLNVPGFGEDAATTGWSFNNNGTPSFYLDHDNFASYLNDDNTTVAKPAVLNNDEEK
ncbi:hypothetical protein VTI74DRAFT_3601 [Chaetomium olivicolor]